MGTPEAAAKKPVSRRSAPLPPAETNYHRRRKLIHLVCFLIFVALPFFNVMRFDIPKQRFYFAGYELWISEFGIIFFTLMFFMFLIVAVSMVYGRLYCSYACPQMIFSEASIAVETALRKWVNKKHYSWPAERKNLLVNAGFYAVLAVASVFLAFVFIAYFVEPRDLLGRLLSLDMRTAGGISGAVVTLITFLDFTLVRQHFCTTVCPYGYLQGMLVDKNTLLVHYRDDRHDCIECKKCVRICHMGIDIRISPYQMECIHCGECIDACEDVLRRLGKPGLIQYVWGEKGEVLSDRAAAWYRRLGFRDAKRVVVMLVILFYLSGLLVALSLREPVLVQVAPDRGKSLYQVADDGSISNQFRLRLANRGREPDFIVLGSLGLPDARINVSENPIPVAAGQELNLRFEVTASHWPGAQDVNHFRITAKSSARDTIEEIPMTFLMPPERKVQ